MESINNKILFGIEFGIRLESTTRNLKDFVTSLLKVNKITSNDSSDTTGYHSAVLKSINEVVLGLENVLKVLSFVVPVHGYC